ncbi:hypothetical protein [Actinocorallia sp. A-T 12471]|uniref:hypothetical protein n=1 Tax=Actinocorallia sp. A-T 12471 TaxID=3089813 RepID=UPI0029D32015|nr:hypothetical protein [Actinocorallia sp. A-T 12471]MDX6740661.1 hypothetical protein [Actinocorallia sp. A-T 12471]
MRVGAVVVVLTLLGASGAAATPTPTPSGWRLERTFGARTWDGADAVLVVASDDVWVFRSWARDFEVRIPVAYHWDGVRWTKVPLPKGLKGGVNRAVARSSDDVWATVSGDQEVRGDAAVLHWDGAHWTVAKKTKALGLEDVTLVGKRGLMAVERDSGESFVWRFDGRKWARTRNERVWWLGGSSANDVWSVALDGGVYRYVKGRWKRQKLGKAVPAHTSCAGGRYPCADVSWGGVVPASRTRTWVFGYLSAEAKESETVETGLLLRRDGDTWKRLPVPRNWIPQRAATDGKGGLWLAGRQLDQPVVENASYKTVTWHVTADGVWQGLPALTAPEGPGFLYALARIPGTRSMIGVGSIRLSDPPDPEESPAKAAIWRLDP